MFKCECGHIFETPERSMERLELDSPRYEEFCICPACGSYDYDETAVCALCGTQERSDIMACGLCYPCQVKTIKEFRAVTEDFTWEQRQYLDECFDGGEVFGR